MVLQSLYDFFWERRPQFSGLPSAVSNQRHVVPRSDGRGTRNLRVLWKFLWQRKYGTQKESLSFRNVFVKRASFRIVWSLLLSHWECYLLIAFQWGKRPIRYLLGQYPAETIARVRPLNPVEDLIENRATLCKTGFQFGQLWNWVKKSASIFQFQ